MNYDETFTYNGLKACIAQPYQVEVLANNIQVSSEFRKDFNLWLGGFFGYKETLPDGEILVAKHLGTMTMNLPTFIRLKQELETRKA